MPEPERRVRGRRGIRANRALGALLLAAGLTPVLDAYAQQARDPKRMHPRAHWSVHAVVTTGTATYEGVKTRAVLRYDEVGNPLLELEQVRVEVGFPDPSRVLWRRPLDIVDKLPKPCPLTLSGCARIENLRFDLSVLHFDLVVEDERVHCVTHGVQEEAPQMKCIPKRGGQAG